MEVVPLTAEHCMSLNVVGIHSAFEMTPDMAVDLEEIGGSAAIYDGHVIAVAGVYEQWPRVGLAWCWLDRRWRAHARDVTEAVRYGLDQSHCHRIEAAVRCDYGPGHRWAERLGFELETPRARKWGPDGSDFSIYVRLKDG